ncbi:MAG: Ku protein, partial [Candidatus Eremiobacterota bacterium]
MARALWSGSISFGMVNIPVKLYPATGSHTVHFHLLHQECKSRVKYQVFCPVHEKVISRSDLVKGYEYARNQYALVTEEDFESLPVPSRSAIELASFVELEDVDPIYFDQSYYLEPDEAGKKAYSLLVRALKEKLLVGIAKITLRNQERICALRPREGALILSTLHYHDEIRELPAGIPESIELSERELHMAHTLIDLLAAEGFHPGEYRDAYKEALMALIERKIQGQEVA